MSAAQNTVDAFTPLTTQDEARAWLAALSTSELSFHIDEDPADTLWDNPPTSEVIDGLRARRDEAFAILGEAAAWETYFQ